MDFQFGIKFEGQDADYHRLPAYAGGQAIEGIARGIILVGHFATTGEIRKRAPFSDGLQLYMTPPRSGSLEILLLGVVSGVAANLMAPLVKRAFNHVVGLGDSLDQPELRDLEQNRSGDLEALTDAVEPALRSAHNVVGEGASNIVIIQGDSNVVNFDASTKRYIFGSTVLQSIQEIEGSVGAFNANTDYGKIYIPEYGKSVPFTIARDSEAGTDSAISSSLDRYTSGLPSIVSCQVRSVVAPDGRIKKLIILAAELVE